MFIFAAALLGLIIGSATNAAIYRLHAKKPGFLTGRSACPHCDHELSALDLVPVLSWVLLGGECRYCHANISKQYPIVELVMAATFALLTWHVGIENFFALGWSLLVAAVLVFIAAYDAVYGEIPDEISLPAIPVAVLASYFSFTPSWSDSLMGLAVGGGLFLLLVLISNGRWMGGGDIRLIALLGALLGWQGVLLTIFLASLGGSLVGGILMYFKKATGQTALPFGPALVAAAFINMIWGDVIISWYLTTLVF